MVTSIAKDVGKRFKGTVNVFIGEENETAASLVGFISRDPGLEFVPSMESAELLVVDNEFPIADDVSTRRADVNFALVQLEAELIAMAMGVTEVGQIVEVGGPPAVQRRFSFKFTGVDADGEAKTIEAPSCTVVSNPTITLNPNVHAKIDVTLKVLGHPDNTFAWRWIDGAGNVVATIAAGVLTRVANTPTTFHKVASQVGGAADVLDTMTGSSLVDGEKVTLQINSVSEPITITDQATGSDFLLDPAADFTMVALADWIQVQYNESGTQWTQIARHQS